MIFFHTILHPAVLVYDFLIFITSSSSFHGFNTNQFKQPAPSWLVSSIGRVLHRYRRGQGFETCTSVKFFRLFFRNYKSCVYNCDELLSYNTSYNSHERTFSKVSKCRSRKCVFFWRVNPPYCTHFTRTRV